MNHAWFNGIDWNGMEQMKVDAVFKPPLASECDTQFFSKEFTQTEILNPEEREDGEHDADDLLTEMMEGDLECLYSVRTADEAENNSAFENYY